MTTDMVRAYIYLSPEDKATLEKQYGYGWSAYIRNLIHDHCTYLRQKPMKDAFGHVDD